MIRKMKNLIIIGVGGFAREVYWLCQNAIGYGTEWQLKGFLDGDVKLSQEEYEKLLLPVLGDINNYKIEEDDVFVIAIADTNVKEKIANLMESKGAHFINVIHNTCTISGNVKMGKGCVFCQNTSLNDNVKVGNFVIFNTYSGMGHDAVIGDFSSVMSYVDITGYSLVGRKTFWGSGSRCVPHSIIGDCAKIGIGSVVLTKIPANASVFGNPARKTGF